MTTFRSLILTGAILTALPLPAAEPRIDNRAAKPNEIGYQPADGESTPLNPPSWTWLHEAGAHTYSVQWARQGNFTGAESVTGVPWNTYTHHMPLPPGEWFWRYRFANLDGRQSNWSVARKVVIPSDAIEFPMPTRAQQIERVPEGRPRLFLHPDDLPRLRELAQGREKERFDQLRRAADRYIAAGPTGEPENLGSARDKNNHELIKYWWPNRVQTMQACEEAETIAFVWLITQEEKYAEAARKWILHLAAWDPDGPTQFHLNCEAAKPLLYRLPRAYDWAYDTLTPADRQLVQEAMRRRAKDAWESWEVRQGTGHLNLPYGSHANRTWHKLGECAIAFLGEIPEAEMWLDYAVNKFYAAYPVWSDDDGGWHEGLSYMGSYVARVVPWLVTAKSALGIDGLNKPFFARVGNFPMYIAPPNSPNSGFADQAHRPPSGNWGALMDYFTRAEADRPGGAERAPYWRWWTEQWGFRGQGGILGFVLHANLPAPPPAQAPLDLPQSRVFRGIGVASLHSDLLDANHDVHFLFKSSPFGRQSHGHNPHNSFQLNAFGETLLTTCVYRDLHGSKFHYQWAHSTRAHNAVLVNGEEQARHTPAPHGRIADFQFTPEWDWVVGEAAAAYAGRLTRYFRHAIFVKPDLIVLYDDLAAKEPSTFQFMLHADREFAVNESTATLSVDLPKAGVAAQYLSPVTLSFRQWDGYEPPPEFREFPTQWHVEAGTREQQRELGMLTVIVPYRAGKQSEWRAERLESDTAIGVRFHRDGQPPVLVGLRKDGVEGRAALAGMEFDAPVTVKR